MMSPSKSKPTEQAYEENHRLASRAVWYPNMGKNRLESGEKVIWSHFSIFPAILFPFL